jgi:hypothetical protein
MEVYKPELIAKRVLLELPGEFSLAGMRGPESRQRSF